MTPQDSIMVLFGKTICICGLIVCIAFALSMLGVDFSNIRRKIPNSDPNKSPSSGVVEEVEPSAKNN